MKFAIVALAAVAAAVPTNTPPKGGDCSVNGDNHGQVACCNSGIPILGSLLCNVLALGNTCSVGQSAYCCNNQAVGGLINVDLLNCVHIL